MSYRITATTIVNLNAWMYASDIQTAHERDDLPEANFIDNCYMRRAVTHDTPSEARVILRDFDWYGGGSGSANETLRAIAEKIHGTVEVIFILEVGESFKGIQIVDGVLTWHEVEMKIGKQVTGDDE